MKVDEALWAIVKAVSGEDETFPRDMVLGKAIVLRGSKREGLRVIRGIPGEPRQGYRFMGVPVLEKLARRGLCEVVTVSRSGWFRDRDIPRVDREGGPSYGSFVEVTVTERGLAYLRGEKEQ